MQFFTISDHFLLNAYRHECRGFNWIELGHDDRAARSFSKAIKNYKKAAELELCEPLSLIVEILADKISKNILNGSSNG